MYRFFTVCFSLEADASDTRFHSDYHQLVREFLARGPLSTLDSTNETRPRAPDIADVTDLNNTAARLRPLVRLKPFSPGRLLKNSACPDIARIRANPCCHRISVQ
jgi:hypothetical protein